MKRLAYLGLLLLVSARAHAIVTVESLTIDGNNLGLSRNFSLELNGSSGNTDKSEGEIGTTWVWRTPEYINYFIASYEYGETNQQINTDNTYVHGRHIRKFRQRIDIESFAQLEEDKFARLNSRKLLGGGLRVAMPNSSVLGLGALYFEERLDNQFIATEDLTDQGVRLNTYYSSDFKYDDRTVFTARLYAQPKADDVSDLRLLLNASVKFAVTTKANIRFSVRATHDSQPPATVDKTNVYYSSGIELSF